MFPIDRTTAAPRLMFRDFFFDPRGTQAGFVRSTGFALDFPGAARHRVGMTLTARNIIDRLELSPHPEGGWYRQTWVADGPGRAAGTCIYFLLQAGEHSRWHKVDAAEIWHYYAGAPLVLRMAATDAGPATRHVLGPDLAQGETPQIIVPPHHWQDARSTGAFTLVGCTVSPGFEFQHFVLAPQGFDIPE